MLGRLQRARQWAIPDSSLPLDQQFFQGLCLLAGLLAIFVIIPINNYPDLNPWVNRGIFIFGVIALAIAWAARRGHYLKKTMVLALVALLDLIWFPNGGSHGSIGLYFFAVALYLVLFYRGLARHAGLLLLIANIVGLHLVELKWPRLAMPFPSPWDRFLDLATGNLISLYLCALMLGVILWGYNRKKVLLDETIETLRSTIADRARVEQEKEQLEAINRQLQKAESLGLMAGSIAHLFNNKLQTVMAHLELLATGQDPESGRHLAQAKLATEKAAEVSRQMLFYLGQVPGEREPLFLGELCWQGLPALHHGLPRNVEVKIIEPGPDPVVWVDRDMILQVLTSLVTNAWEAMGEAGGLIQLGISSRRAEAIPERNRFPLGWVPKDPAYACLEVADSGSGIQAAAVEKLFDPFFSTKFVGRGLGLSVVLGIVQAHGGALAVESEPGRGSVFRVFLPLAAGAVPERLEAPAAPPAPAPGLTVLLVDDDEALLESARELLEALAFSALTARDGVEAVELFRRHPGTIHCVITDLTMPRMNGWETLSALRRLDPDLPVILASGYDRAQVMAGVHPDLPQAFLEKPFTLKQLQEALGRALG